MKYNEICVNINSNDVDVVSAVCIMTVPYGIYIEDYSDIDELQKSSFPITVDIIDEKILEKDRTIAKIHIYIDENKNPAEAVSFIEERLNSENISYSIDNFSVDEEDYANSWKKYFHPTRIGENIVVVPSWETYSPKQDDIILNLDPGMAFGSGTHETTSLCIELIEKYTQKNHTVLDIGCGSGILAITSILVGAESAIGCDIDPVAIKVSIENSKLNNTFSKTKFVESNLDNNITGKYDIICANIVADVILKLSDNIQDYMSEESVFITSGIIDSRADEVQAKFNSLGFTIKDKLTKNGWVAFAVSK